MYRVRCLPPRVVDSLGRSQTDSVYSSLGTRTESVDSLSCAQVEGLLFSNALHLWSVIESVG